MIESGLEKWLNSSTNEDENQAQEEMDIEAHTTQPGNKRKERSLTSEAGNQPKKKSQQDSQMVVAQMPQVIDGQPGDQDENWHTLGKNGSADDRKESETEEEKALLKKRLP